MNRFKELRKQHHYSQNELANILFVNQTAVSQWERGVTTPSPNLLLRLCDLYQTTTDYLLGRDAAAPEGPPASTGGVWVPVLGSVAAGTPIEAVQDIRDYEEISADMAGQGEHFGLVIKGDSMEPKISSGDVVIVRRQSDVENGQIAVVMVNGDEATVKRIKKRPEGLMLIPSNPAYEPMFYSNREIEELPVIIIGRVVELRAKF